MNSLMVIEGIEVRRDVQGRYCLNDLHRAAGGEDRHKPSNFMRMDSTRELCAEIDRCSDVSIGCIETIRGGNGQGTYVSREVVFAYAMWISPAFHLKVIRTFDAVVNQYQHTASLVATDKIQAGVILLESAARMLNLSNSSKLGAYQKLQKVAGLPDLMPSYAIDAPSDASDGSSRPTFAISVLLRQHGIRMTASQAYHQLAKLGVVEQKYRESRSGINGIKKFWSVTPKGCMYGKNITSPVNPRETQPHFFEYRFPDLLKLLETVH
ncbi:KilA-N domain-containing protein [Salmonella enterica]|uniref:KilA-N domain-containing protein n=3 Tax=Salmonella enterica I TaxID=59201 RepID=A0A5V6DMP2_SALET|nr:KilA-N domain-containing protein [Salmonella enterica]EBH9884236.1 KilA-N domain-containing protein [Salmonella enterica subsp. enterica serovar Kisarawe]EBP4061092.1 KilA-N domain-containing protein [Salmonella enterica subsp. enterica]EBQ9204099.1 KilA-N domain-containing protein [Salmonella enterica subsp. enterica serovar Anecho]EBR9059842.1 KilA-N domain-containing protein [Salmonella enterica subsp. enterica serovar Koketime]EBS5142296.1 KilA-N domain-containing protein [Salmonella en